MTKGLHWLPVVSRVAASLLGGYLFTWGFTTLLIALALMAGTGYDDARTLAYLLAFLVYLGAFIWTFAAASLVRVWLALGGGGAMMAGTAWWITRTLSVPY